jgi:hypothetical protein
MQPTNQQRGSLASSAAPSRRQTLLLEDDPAAELARSASHHGPPKAKQTHPDTGQPVEIWGDETFYDTVETTVVDGVELEVNRLGRVQCVALVRIDNTYQPGDRFGVLPEQAASLYKQRTRNGQPVIELVPGAPEPPPPPITRRRATVAQDGWPRGPSERTDDARVAGADMVRDNGVLAMRLALKSADRELPSSASDGEVAAAFREAFGSALAGVPASTTGPTTGSGAPTTTGQPPADGSTMNLEPTLKEDKGDEASKGKRAK